MLIIYTNDESPFEFPDLQVHNSMSLCERLLLEWCQVRVALSCAYKPANTAFMNGCNQLPLRVPKMQNQTLLTLH
jgi:hypothetical protein